VKHLFARTAVLVAVGSAAMLGGLPAHAAATAPSSVSYTADRGDDGVIGWWKEFWYGEEDNGDGWPWSR
jgi:hypothetical protein